MVAWGLRRRAGEALSPTGSHRASSVSPAPALGRLPLSLPPCSPRRREACLAPDSQQETFVYCSFTPSTDAGWGQGCIAPWDGGRDWDSSASRRQPAPEGITARTAVGTGSAGCGAEGVVVGAPGRLAEVLGRDVSSREARLRSRMVTSALVSGPVRVSRGSAWERGRLSPARAEVAGVPRAHRK